MMLKLSIKNVLHSLSLIDWNVVFGSWRRVTMVILTRRFLEIWKDLFFLSSEEFCVEKIKSMHQCMLMELFMEKNITYLEKVLSI